MPELVASLCTLLVLAPLALMPGLGTFLFRPMALAVAFAMISAYFLSRTFVPAMCMLFLRSHGPLAEVHPGQDYEHRNPHEYGPPPNFLSRAFARWETMINTFIAGYLGLLRRAMRARTLVVGSAVAVLVVVIVVFWPRLRREFFPEVDAGAFEIYVRGKTGTRIEETER